VQGGVGRPINKSTVITKWRTDELVLRIKGDRKYFFAMLDNETRFWIAKQVADKKWFSDIRPMYREAQEVAGKKPKILITDGVANFAITNRKEWQTRYKDNTTQHIRDINFNGIHNNNYDLLKAYPLFYSSVLIKRLAANYSRIYLTSLIRPYEARSLSKMTRIPYSLTLLSRETAPRRLCSS
jgi:hypothetical protein